MAPPHSTLTLTSRVPNASSIVAGHGTAADPTTQSHLSSKRQLSTSDSTTVASPSLEPSLSMPSIARLIDYPSTEDEVETEHVQRFKARKTAVRKITGLKQYQSENLVTTNSENPKRVASLKERQSHRHRPKSEENLVSSLHDIAPATSDKMVRMESYSRSASSSQPSRNIRKRPQPPPESAPAVKRPRSGPFDTDTDSEADGNDEKNDEVVFLEERIRAPKSSPGNVKGNVQYPPHEHRGMRPSRSNQQRQESNSIAGDRLPSSKPMSPSQPGKTLNLGRFKTLLANKQGGVKAQTSEQRAPNLALPKQSMHNTEVDLSLQEEPPIFPTGESKLAPGTSSHNSDAQQKVRSSTPKDTPIPATFPNGSATRPLNEPNSDPLRNASGRTKPDHRSALKAPKSEWRRPLARRRSKKSTSNVRRPEAGARYGHTLTARATSAAELPGNRAVAPTAKDRRTLVQRKQTSPPAPPSGIASNGALQQNTRSCSVSNFTAPVDPSTVGTISRSTRNAKHIAHDQSSEQISSMETPTEVIQPTSWAATTEQADILSLPMSSNKESRRTSSPDPAPTSQPSSTSKAHHGPSTSYQLSTAGYDDQSESSMAIPSTEWMQQSTDCVMRPNPTNCYPAAFSHSDMKSVDFMDTAELIQPALRDSCGSVIATSKSISLGSITPTERLNTETIEAQGSQNVSVERLNTDAYNAPNATDTSLQNTSRDSVPEVKRQPERDASVVAQSTNNGLASAPEVFGSGSCDNAGLNEGTNDGDAEELPSLSALSNMITTQPASAVGRRATDMSPYIPSDVSNSEQRPLRPSESTEKVCSEPCASSIRERATLQSPTIKDAHQDCSSYNLCPRRSQSMPAPPDLLTSSSKTQLLRPQENTQILLLGEATSSSSLQPRPAQRTVVESEHSPRTLPAAARADQAYNFALPGETALASPNTSTTAEPYFEYTIHQILSSQSSNNNPIKLSEQPLTNLHTANSQTERLLESTKLYFELCGMHCKSTQTQTNNGLRTHKAIFQSHEDPTKTLTLQLWIQRTEVGVFTNHTPSPTPAPPTIRKTLYTLRLWRLLEVPLPETPATNSSTSTSTCTSTSTSDSDSDSDTNSASDHTHEDNPKLTTIRIHHPLPPLCTELHTTLHTANLAAKRVQIALSHQLHPTTPLQVKWQADNALVLERKLDELRREVADFEHVGAESGQEGDRPSAFEYGMGRRRGCWREVFLGSRGHADCSYEVMVCEVGVSGPRNL